MPPLEIVDAHVHFWDLGRNYYPWLSDPNPPRHRYGDHKAIRRNHLPADYAASSAGYKVTGVVHIEAVIDPKAAVNETHWLAELRDKTGLPTVAMAFAVLEGDDVEATLAAHSRFPFVRGIRYRIPLQASHAPAAEGQRAFLDNPKFRRGYAFLEHFGFACDVAVPFRHLHETADLAHEFPHTQIILNHCGGPHDRSPEGLDTWRAGMTRLAREPNVAVKVSGIGMPDRAWTPELNAPIMRDTIRIFGPDRCMFASNFPPDSLVADFRTLVQTTDTVVSELAPDSREKIFRDNTRRVYRIP